MTVLPIEANTCRACQGVGERDGGTCISCAGSGVTRADAAMREHWGFTVGRIDHAIGLRSDDSPFARDTFADRCWRAGWNRAERDAITASHAEKIDADRRYG